MASKVKPAHIQNTEGIEVGQRTIGICGTEFKVRMLWDQIPRDYPMCRDCVDTAVDAMNDATGQVLNAAAFAIRLRGVAKEAVDALLDGDSTLMLVLERTNEFSEKQEAKAAAKAEKKAAKKAIKKAEKSKQAATE